MIGGSWRGGMAREAERHVVAYARCRWCGWSRTCASPEQADNARVVHAAACPWQRRTALQQRDREAA